MFFGRAAHFPGEMGCEAGGKAVIFEKCHESPSEFTQVTEFKSVDEDEIFVLFGMIDKEKAMELADEEEAKLN